jgi:hypothetical protein
MGADADDLRTLTAVIDPIIKRAESALGACLLYSVRCGT